MNRRRPLLLLTMLFGMCANASDVWGCPKDASLCVIGDEVLVRAASFEMGAVAHDADADADEKAHKVTLSRSFRIRHSEVTQAEWTRFFANNPSAKSKNRDKYPVDSVTWYDALAWCNAASQAEKLELCYDLSGCTGTPGVDFSCPDSLSFSMDCSGYRLPTEAEWEMAAKTALAFDSFPELPGLQSLAWFSDNAEKKTHAVATTPVVLTIADIFGNVAEWVWDRKGPYSGDSIDPLGPSTGEKRVLRGGSYKSKAKQSRASYRNEELPSKRGDGLGFRPVRSVPHDTKLAAPVVDEKIAPPTSTDSAAPFTVHFSLLDGPSHSLAAFCDAYTDTPSACSHCEGEECQGCEDEEAPSCQTDAVMGKGTHEHLGLSGPIKALRIIETSTDWVYHFRACGLAVQTADGWFVAADWLQCGYAVQGWEKVEVTLGELVQTTLLDARPLLAKHAVARHGDGTSMVDERFVGFCTISAKGLPICSQTYSMGVVNSANETDLLVEGGAVFFVERSSGRRIPLNFGPN